MYKFKANKIQLEINVTKASEKIGITRPYLSNILNGNVLCSKPVAYCITKYINRNYEINDLFEKEGK